MVIALFDTSFTVSFNSDGLLTLAIKPDISNSLPS